MINEKLFDKPFPSERCCKLRTHEMTQDLSVKEGDLCFFRVRIKDTAIDIWILEDNANWCWSKRYNVSLNWGADKNSVAVGGVHRGLDFCFCDAKRNNRGGEEEKGIFLMTVSRGNEIGNLSEQDCGIHPLAFPDWMLYLMLKMEFAWKC
ncbi:hypothetical protein Salat_1525200 [Sesamum alatum]|uniref:F-box associated domain-containing protein n=1 Tax=Sesamum alatum TaxID=300844 RepID=A0AAE2CMG2_9LAMI|nr:hypothetical protein Salat_1525200 [Sesamum alatum]